MQCKKIIFTILFLLLFISSKAYAEVSVEASVSSDKVAVGEEITFDITITNASGSISQPAFSSIDGFSSYSQGHSQEITMINGQMSSKSVFTYILIANAEGKKTIGPFDIVIGGKPFKTPPIPIEVLPSGTSTGSTGRKTSMNARGPVVSPVSRALPQNGPTTEDIFVKDWLDKDEVYVNEPVILTYTLYTRLSATYKGFEKEPQTTGFWVEDFPPEKTMNRTEKILNNSRYVVADVRKIALFPTQPGVFTIDAGVLATMVEVRGEDDFDSFFSSSIFGHRSFGLPSGFGSQIVPKTILTQPVHLTVKALPAEGRPANFTGAVGRFQIQSNLEKSEVEQGIPISYRIRIRGIGNINTIQPPSLTDMPDFKIYDSSSSVNISKNRLMVEGEKITETVLVPKKSGVFTIPSLSFSYFDPETKFYKTMGTPTHILAVKPGPKGEEVQNPSMGIVPVEKESVPLLGRDIRYIKLEEDGKRISKMPLYKNPFYWILNVLILIMGLILKLLSSPAESFFNDKKGDRARRSHRAAKSKLKGAHKLLKREKSDEFYAEISRAVYGYFADKLNITAQNVNLESIESLVKTDKTAKENLMDDIKILFDKLALGRFGRAGNTEEVMKDVYLTADQVITDFERVKIK